MFSYEYENFFMRGNGLLETTVIFNKKEKIKEVKHS